jgi:mono/diheme cytochrome c family protein
MAQQPRYRPLQPSDFFPDGRSSRSLEPGTVARRNSFRDDARLDSGVIGNGAGSDRVASLVGLQGALGVLAAAAVESNPVARYHKDLPFRLNYADLQRGQQRFNIYCSGCHDRLGTGNGIVVQRGFTRPPNFLTDDSRGLRFQGARVPLKDVPAGYIFDVITHGYGAMPSHAAQVPPRDRWLIAAYVRALQLRNVPVRLEDLKPEERQVIEEQLRKAGGGARP